MSRKRVVIALGGNAIKQAHEKGTTEEQFRNVDVAAREIAKIAKAGWDVVLTHGNGPQAGALLIQQEEAHELVPPQTLTACGAMTQGQIGWMLQNKLQHYLAVENVKMPVVTIITQVEVSEDDPDFDDPSKPVGPFFTENEARDHAEEKGWIVKEVKRGVEKSWRRVVPSPEPIAIVEADAITTLLGKDILVIASGGGGIPVKKNSDHSYSGIDAVIDKDRAGFKLSQAVQADLFLILTDVEHAFVNFNTSGQKALETCTIGEIEKHLADGQFLKGSMGPKIEAALRFVKWSGKEAVITSLNNALDAIEGKTGTRIKG